MMLAESLGLQKNTRFLNITENMFRKRENVCWEYI